MAARKDYAAKAAVMAGQPDTATVQDQAAEAVALTVNGKPIPDHFKHAIPFAQTDQGILAANEAIKASGRYTENRTSVVSGEWDKTLDRFEADSGGNEPWENADPIKAAIARCADSKGKAFHLMSEAIVKRNGMRGFVVERDTAGNLVEVGNMVLGSMPQAKADKRDQYYQGLAAEAGTKQDEKFYEEQQRASSVGITPLRPGESIRATNTPNGAVTEIGLHRTVGNSGAILNGG